MPERICSTPPLKGLLERRKTLLLIGVIWILAGGMFLASGSGNWGGFPAALLITVLSLFPNRETICLCLYADALTITAGERHLWSSPIHVLRPHEVATVNLPFGGTRRPERLILRTQDRDSYTLPWKIFPEDELLAFPERLEHLRTGLAGGSARKVPGEPAGLHS